MNKIDLHKIFLSENLEKLDKALQSFKLSLDKCCTIGLKNEYSFEESETFDSMTSKFARLNDIYVQKILRTVFLLLHEDNKTLIDLANRAENLNMISNADNLLILRDIRNQISHEYEDENLNAIYSEIIESIEPFFADIDKTKAFIVKNNLNPKFQNS